MGTYIIGGLVIVLGVFMVLKTPWFISMFGKNDWAEANLGGGGTYTFYKLLGIGFILGSMMLMTGMLGEIFLVVFGRMFGGLAT